MRGLIHLIGITSILFTMHACSTVTETPKVTIQPATVPLMGAFDYRVSQWSLDANNTIKEPYEGTGNCTPVAVELQKRITKTGRMAIIVAVDPPGNGPNHAMVMYAHEKGGKFSRLIDNGYLTKSYPKRSEGLYNGVFGKYLGVCKKPEGNRCVLDEPF